MMDVLKEFVGLDGLADDDFVSAATDIFCTGEIIHSFKNPRESTNDYKISDQEGCEAVIKNPSLAIGIVLLARLERLHCDYLESQKTTHLLIQDAIENTYQAGAKTPPANTVKITALESQQVYEALKAIYEKLHPLGDAKDYQEAMRQFAELAGV